MALGCYGSRSGSHPTCPHFHIAVNSMWLNLWISMQIFKKKESHWLCWGKMFMTCSNRCGQKSGSRGKIRLSRLAHTSGPILKTIVSSYQPNWVELAIIPRDNRHKLGLSLMNQDVYLSYLEEFPKKGIVTRQCTGWVHYDEVEQKLVKNLLDGRKYVLYTFVFLSLTWYLLWDT